MVLQGQFQEKSLEAAKLKKELRHKHDEMEIVKKQIYSHSQITDSLYTISMVVDKHMKGIGMDRRMKHTSLVDQMKVFVESLQQHAE